MFRKALPRKTWQIHINAQQQNDIEPNIKKENKGFIKSLGNFRN
jgi:hypothetical protein